MTNVKQDKNTMLKEHSYLDNDENDVKNLGCLQDTTTHLPLRKGQLADS